MSDLLTAFYPWIKSFHIIAVISWMAGLFYLPRIFVYHVEKSNGQDNLNDVFLIMEKKLHAYIMNPAMIVSWICGILLSVTPGIIDFSQMWVWFKLVSIVCMTFFNIWLGLKIDEFKEGKNILSGKQYRLLNEVPTVLLIVIVLSVVLKF